MFTGIIRNEGIIKKIDPPASALSASDWRAGNKKNGKYFTIEAKNFLRNVNIGDSIACDGTCLTVIKKTKDTFRVELMPETLRATKFKKAKVGDLVNIELALRLGERIDGHFTMGHIDEIGKIREITKDGKFKNLIISVPKKIIKYLTNKGSVAVNGVSLTISGVHRDWFKVSLITHTLKETNLSKLKKGDLVNIEVDMIARYLEKLIKQ